MSSPKVLVVVRCIISVFIISWPLLFFVEKNIFQPNLSFEFLGFLCAIFLTICLLITICNRFLVYIINAKKPEWSLDLLSISVSFTFTLFAYSVVKISTENSRASLAFIGLSFLFFYKINSGVFSRPNARKIYTTFLATMIIMTCSQIVFKIPMSFVDSPSVEDSLDFMGEKFTSKKRSVYYIILDAQTSFDQIEKLRSHFNIEEFGEELRDIKQKFDDSLHSIENSRSSYNTTFLTLRSIFDLGYSVTEKSKRYVNRGIMFPGVMDIPSNLSNILLDNGYELIWAGNYWGPCRAIIFKCLKHVKVIDYTIYTRETVEDFLPILKSGRIIFYKFMKKVGINPTSTLKNREKFTPVIQAFYNKVRSFDNKPKFVFVHEFAPHEFYGPNCGERLKSTTGFSTTENVKRYLTSSLCALRSSLKAVLEIKRKDSEAIIVVQGDHGTQFLGGQNMWKRELKDINIEMPAVQERMSILNYVSLPADCNLDLSAATTNVLTSQAAISCALGYMPKLDSAKSYWGMYEDNPSYGVVKKIIGFRNE